MMVKLETTYLCSLTYISPRNNNIIHIFVHVFINFYSDQLYNIITITNNKWLAVFNYDNFNMYACSIDHKLTHPVSPTCWILLHLFLYCTTIDVCVESIITWLITCSTIYIMIQPNLLLFLYNNIHVVLL